ncbi:MAG: hypothetical protein ACREU2_00210 [Steroidobacteraceae bacterium]
MSLAAQSAVHAQGRRAPAGPPPSAKAAAPIDLTGHWTSVTTFDWEFRMVTPRPGDYENVPLTAAGIKIMDAWDPAKVTAAGEQCKSYGAPSVMRNPEHLRISWQDDQTLKMETDAGEQTRLFHFVPSMADAHGPRTWQGYSVAEWQFQRHGRSFGNPGVVVWGTLEVKTTDLKAGFLRKNGIPYSENAKLLEDFDLLPKIGGEQMLAVSTVVTDPVYLSKPFMRDAIFKKLSSDAGWEPSACSATW